MVEDVKTALETVRKLDDLHVKPSLRHSLPSDLIKSRLSTALVWSAFGLQKKVVVVLMVLSKRSRAFVISQRGLPGFLVTRHDNIASLMHAHFPLTGHFKCDGLNEVDLDQLEASCSTFETSKEIEKELRRVYPEVFVALLRTQGREEEVSDLDDGTYLTYSWHIILTLLPSLAKQRAEGKFGYVKEKQIYVDDYSALYTGEVNDKA